MAVQLTRAGVALTVGIIVVTGLIAGGLLFVKHSGEQARHEEAVKIAEQNLEAQSNKEVALNNGKSDESDDKPSDKQTDKGSSKPANEAAGGSADGSVAATVDELPQTGASDVSALLVIGAITYAAVLYGQSKRALFELR